MPEEQFAGNRGKFLFGHSRTTADAGSPLENGLLYLRSAVANAAGGRLRPSDSAKGLDGEDEKAQRTRYCSFLGGDLRFICLSS